MGAEIAGSPQSLSVSRKYIALNANNNLAAGKLLTHSRHFTLVHTCPFPILNLTTRRRKGCHYHAISIALK